MAWTRHNEGCPTQFRTTCSDFSTFPKAMWLYPPSFQNAWCQKGPHPVEVKSMANLKERLLFPRPGAHEPLRSSKMQHPQE